MDISFTYCALHCIYVDYLNRNRTVYICYTVAQNLKAAAPSGSNPLPQAHRCCSIRSVRATLETLQAPGPTYYRQHTRGGGGSARLAFPELSSPYSGSRSTNSVTVNALGVSLVPDLRYYTGVASGTPTQNTRTPVRSCLIPIGCSVRVAQSRPYSTCMSSSGNRRRCLCQCINARTPRSYIQRAAVQTSDHRFSHWQAITKCCDVKTHDLGLSSASSRACGAQRVQILSKHSIERSAIYSTSTASSCIRYSAAGCTCCISAHRVPRHQRGAPPSSCYAAGIL